MSAAILCRYLKMEFGAAGARQSVLRGVNFEAEAGRLTMIAGPSGCGKSTLLSILGGLLTPTGGDAAVFGQSLGNMSARARARYRRQDVGFIFQQYNLVPALTAAENAAAPLIIGGTKRAVAVDLAREELSRLGLAAHTEKFPRQLSGGQQQRVAIARALVHHPRLIICDEPTAALDSTTGEAVMNILSEISCDPGRAVIIVTHDTRIFEYADHLIELEDGLVIRNEYSQTPASPRREAA
ncbi:MAG: ABC transporter ATP-binding protein [Parvularculaceae bacterium]|nr:ABC transporter ATP-binding protein [Parvularculaceae bacterium]